MGKAIIWFKNLDRNKQIIIVLIIVMAILWGLTNIMKSWRNNPAYWDYNTENIDQKALQGSQIEYNRNTYWTLQLIVDRYINSYLYEVAKENYSGDKVSYKEYYKELDAGYKKKISKSKYEEKAQDLMSNIVLQEEQYEEHYTVLPTTIEKINRYGQDMYLCTIKVDDQDGIEFVKGRGYIGVKLDQKRNIFRIFYLGGQYE